MFTAAIQSNVRGLRPKSSDSEVGRSTKIDVRLVVSIFLEESSLCLNVFAPGDGTPNTHRW